MNPVQILINGVQRLINGVQRLINGVQILINGVQRLINGVQRFINGVQRFINAPQRLVSKKITTRWENLYFPILTKEKLVLESCASASPLFVILPKTSYQIADKSVNAPPTPTPQVVRFLLMLVLEYENNQD